MAETIFISYQRDECRFAERLRTLLREWGYNTWLDLDDIPLGVTPGSERGWNDAIHLGLQHSQIVVGVITPKALQSANVKDEWQWALDNKLRLILLRLKKFSMKDMLPPFNRIQYIDLVGDYQRGIDRLQATLASPIKLPPSATGFIRSVPSSSLESQPQKRKNERDLLLVHVRKYWIEGVLQPTLNEREALTIRHQFRPEMVLKSVSAGDYRLPSDAQIADIFKALNCELLILGKPGAGKTVMLLQLADALITEAQNNPHTPIPVVLNLASWALKREPFDRWIVSEVSKVYQVPVNKVRSWLNNCELLLLLDGLDEVNENYRDVCVTDINRFREEYHRLINMAVCSRVQDYEKLSSRFNLFAIELKPLSNEQIKIYLERNNQHDLYRLVEKDPFLFEMAQTPFLLNTMAFVYQDSSYIELVVDTLYERRTHLFNEYIKRQFLPGDSRFGVKNSTDYLTWLATKMQAYVQTVFYIDDIDYQWLRSDVQQYRSFWIMFAILVCAPLVLVYGIVGMLSSGISMALALMGWGFLVGLKIMSGTNLWGHTENIGFVGFRVMGRKIADNFNPFGFVFIAACIIGIIVSHLLPSMLLNISPFIITVLALIVYLLWEKRAEFWKNISSDGDLLRIQEPELITASILVYSITFAKIVDSHWLVSGILMLASVILVVTSLLAFEPRPFPIKTSPESGIRNAIRLALAVWLLVGVLFGIMGILFFDVWRCLALGIAVGLSINLFYGGMTISQHLALRFALRHQLPWHLGKFLETVTNKNILRMVGGGYIFRHRYLMEHFASPANEISTLINQLPEEQSEEALVRIGPSAIEPLTVTLSDQDIQRRAAVGRALGQIGDPTPGVGLRHDGTPDIIWCEIPSGRFTMGGDAEASNASRTSMEFDLPYVYWLAKYPTTVIQYAAFVEAKGYEHRRYWTPDGWEWKGSRTEPFFWNDSKCHLSNHPVVGVSWYEAYAYAQWLDELREENRLPYLPETMPSDHNIRLLYECEWEKAARIPDGRKFPWGDEFDGARANWSYSGIRRTSAVELFPEGANPTHGACDLSGNVWEWLLTAWQETYQTPQSETNGPDVTCERTIRGGSWITGDKFLRAASRNKSFPNEQNIHTGFRVALSVSKLL